MQLLKTIIIQQKSDKIMVAMQFICLLISVGT